MDIDERLIRALQQNGRASYRELAQHLGVPRNVVSTRLRTLLAQDRIRIVAAADPAFLGEHAIAHVAITGRGELTGVINRLSERIDVPLVSATSGMHDLVAEVRTSDTSSLYGILAWIRSFEEVATINVLLYTDIVKGLFVSRYGGGSTVDEIDAELIELLRQDGRRSYRELAGDVRLSPTAVRNRVRRMLEAGILTVSAVITHTAQSGRVKVGMGLNLGAQTREVVDELVGYPELEFAALSIGRFDLVATLNSGAPAELFSRLEDIKGLPGVDRMETWFHLTTFKEDYARSTSLPFAQSGRR
ncbi:Lrp/AsnC family transcriptional regulator [Sediminivirga luteola]|uniref:Lrp/AsnC family transcriptional regulator n=1 Tax=Sediminivirga luteola TaxID=1774748 RepID=UPI001F5A19DA|nr:Lrp/AsnC family transcriptional regulator [Sediminivirga luteola]MCI2265247.1 Lrp/AsnC family transcriptional regulator [Sediminivirga luteola]